MTQIEATPELVGRDRECARLEEFVGSVPHGARALLVRGEPGIGKTTLWRRGLSECGRASHRVLVARPGEEEMQLGLTGLVDLFGEVADVTADNPFTRGHAVLAVLRGLADGGPVILAIDDLQWLDNGSARALRFALRRLDEEPVGLLATMRDGGDPLAAAATLPPGRTEELVLGPLGLAELRRLLSHAVDAISAPMLQRIYEVSAGNPLYALELARELERSGGNPPGCRCRTPCRRRSMAGSTARANSTSCCEPSRRSAPPRSACCATRFPGRGSRRNSTRPRSEGCSSSTRGCRSASRIR